LDGPGILAPDVLGRELDVEQVSCCLT
jgi:hypothetical protein